MPVVPEVTGADNVLVIDKTAEEIEDEMTGEIEDDMTEEIEDEMTEEIEDEMADEVEGRLVMLDVSIVELVWVETRVDDDVVTVL